MLFDSSVLVISLATAGASVDRSESGSCDILLDNGSGAGGGRTVVWKGDRSGLKRVGVRDTSGDVTRSTIRWMDGSIGGALCGSVVLLDGAAWISALAAVGVTVGWSGCCCSLLIDGWGKTSGVGVSGAWVGGGSSLVWVGSTVAGIGDCCSARGDI